MNQNPSALKLLEMFDNVIDHGTAAHADALFLDVEQSSQQTRDEVYDLLEERAIEQIKKDRRMWDHFVWNLGPLLSREQYEADKQVLVKELERLKPLTQILYHVSQHKGKEAHPWVRDFAPQFANLSPEGKNSVEKLATFLLNMRQSGGYIFDSEPYAAVSGADAFHKVAEKNHQKLKALSQARKTRLVPKA